MSWIALAAFILLMSSLPYAIFPRHRLGYLLWDLSSYLFLASLWLLSLVLEIRLEPSLRFAIVVVAKLAVFAVFLIRQEQAEGWNANRAGLFAGLLYLCLVPHVQQWPIDGDEPYYLLVTESLVFDHDLDLRNQYATIVSSATKRPDLRPQLGDPVGRRGQQYSRTEPFLSVVLIPGFLLFGLQGALATIAIFGGLLVRSTLRLLEEEGFSSRASRLCFVFLALLPPVVFYATRIWPEVPAAFCLAETLRGLRARRFGSFVIAVLGLALLKLRFALIAVVLLVLAFVILRPRLRTVLIVLALLTLPFLAIFIASGQWLNVHGLWELTPQNVGKYPRGIFGLLLDAQAGLLFQAPFYLIAAGALLLSRILPATAKWGLASAAVYLILLFPRDEWHGGWSPPLRYLVVLTPVLCLAAATLIDYLRPVLLALIAILSAAVTVHGLAFPWRLFHIANGESVFGEFLSARYGSDLSRMLPSFIRVNRAAIVMSIFLVLVVVAALIFRRFAGVSRVPGVSGVSGLEPMKPLKPLKPIAELLLPLPMAILALLIAAAFTLGRQPGKVVHFEDSHVTHRGGELYPHQWTVARFAYTGGWRLRTGDSVSFNYSGGESLLYYLSPGPAQLEIDSVPIAVKAVAGRFRSLPISTPRASSHTIRCLAGEVVLDRIEEQ